MKIGFIGLGSMGAPIARRLARSGFDVIGCDIAPEMLQAFDEPGTTRSSEPIETARRYEWCVSCRKNGTNAQPHLMGWLRVFRQGRCGKESGAGSGTGRRGILERICALHPVIC